MKLCYAKRGCAALPYDESSGTWPVCDALSEAVLYYVKLLRIKTWRTFLLAASCSEAYVRDLEDLLIWLVHHFAHVNHSRQICTVCIFGDSHSNHVGRYAFT